MPWPMLGSLERLDTDHRRDAPASHHRGARLSGVASCRSGALLEAQLRGIRVEEGVEVYERLTGKLADRVAHAEPPDLLAGFSPRARRPRRWPVR